MIEERVQRRKRFETSWLIVCDAGDRREILMLGSRGDEATLPIFSFEEEALLFLQFSGLRDSWTAIKNNIAELDSVFTDLRLDARRIALDPIPELGLEGPHDLVSLSRKEFARMLAS